MTAAKPVEKPAKLEPVEKPAKLECYDCAKLPSFDQMVNSPGPFAEFRPKIPRKIDPRSLQTHKTAPRCTTHWLAWRKAASLRERTRQKTKRYGVPREIQVILWEFQGSSCPCGRKAAEEIPPGVTLDHEHRAPCIVRGDHDEKTGCLQCVTGFVCSHCNREIIGKLEGAFRKRLYPRDAVIAAFDGLREHLSNPPLWRLRAERPELFRDVTPAEPRTMTRVTPPTARS